MTGTMKAAVLRTIGTPLAIETLPIPEPKPGEVLIKVTACGVCHSDLHAVEGDWQPLPNLPLIPGHEVVGTVAKAGEGVSHFAVGDRIGVPWMYSACGHCEFCLSGMETICLKAEATGYSKPGGYAEYMIADAAFCGHIPDGVDAYELAPILCAGVTTYRGLKRTGVRPGQWLTVIGIGGLGHIAVQYAKAMGMRVAAVDVSDEKLALAKSYGAELLVNAAASDPGEAIKAAIGGTHGAVVTAVSARAFEQSISVLRNGGTVCWIGLSRRQAGRDPHHHLRHRQWRNVGARIECRHPAGPSGIDRLRRPRPRQGADREGPAGRRQRHLRAHEEGPDQRPRGSGDRLIALASPI